MPRISPAALDVVQALGHFHAAALAAATGMDLGLDHPHAATELLRGFNSLLHSESRVPRGTGTPN
jgi:hypothetical protein